MVMRIDPNFERTPIDREPEFQPPVPTPPVPPPPSTSPAPRFPERLPREPVPPAPTLRQPRRLPREPAGGPVGLGGGTFATPALPRTMAPFRTSEFPVARGMAPYSPEWLGAGGASGPAEMDDDVRRYLRTGGRVVL